MSQGSPDHQLKKSDDGATTSLSPQSYDTTYTADKSKPPTRAPLTERQILPDDDSKIVSFSETSSVYQESNKSDRFAADSDDVFSPQGFDSNEKENFSLQELCPARDQNEDSDKFQSRADKQFVEGVDNDERGKNLLTFKPAVTHGSVNSSSVSEFFTTLISGIQRRRSQPPGRVLLSEAKNYWSDDEDSIHQTVEKSISLVDDDDDNDDYGDDDNDCGDDDNDCGLDKEPASTSELDILQKSSNVEPIINLLPTSSTVSQKRSSQPPRRVPFSEAQSYSSDEDTTCQNDDEQENLDVEDEDDDDDDGCGLAGKYVLSSERVPTREFRNNLTNDEVKMEFFDQFQSDEKDNNDNRLGPREDLLTSKPSDSQRSDTANPVSNIFATLTSVSQRRRSQPPGRVLISQAKHFWSDDEDSIQETVEKSISLVDDDNDDYGDDDDNDCGGDDNDCGLDGEPASTSELDVLPRSTTFEPIFNFPQTSSTLPQRRGSQPPRRVPVRKAKSYLTDKDITCLNDDDKQITFDDKDDGNEDDDDGIKDFKPVFSARSFTSEDQLIQTLSFEDASVMISSPPENFSTVSSSSTFFSSTFSSKPAYVNSKISAFTTNIMTASSEAVKKSLAKGGQFADSRRLTDQANLYSFESTFSKPPVIVADKHKSIVNSRVSGYSEPMIRKSESILSNKGSLSGSKKYFTPDCVTTNSPLSSASFQTPAFSYSTLFGFPQTSVSRKSTSQPPRRVTLAEAMMVNLSDDDDDEANKNQSNQVQNTLEEVEDDGDDDVSRIAGENETYESVVLETNCTSGDQSQHLTSNTSSINSSYTPHSISFATPFLTNSDSLISSTSSVLSTIVSTFSSKPSFDYKELLTNKVTSSSAAIDLPLMGSRHNIEDFQLPAAPNELYTFKTPFSKSPSLAATRQGDYQPIYMDSIVNKSESFLSSNKESLSGSKKYFSPDYVTTNSSLSSSSCQTPAFSYSTLFGFSQPSTSVPQTRRSQPPGRVLLSEAKNYWSDDEDSIQETVEKSISLVDDDDDDNDCGDNDCGLDGEPASTSELDILQKSSNVEPIINLLPTSSTVSQKRSSQPARRVPVSEAQNYLTDSENDDAVAPKQPVGDNVTPKHVADDDVNENKKENVVKEIQPIIPEKIPSTRGFDLPRKETVISLSSRVVSSSSKVISSSSKGAESNKVLYSTSSAKMTKKSSMPPCDHIHGHKANFEPPANVDLNSNQRVENARGFDHPSRETAVCHSSRDVGSNVVLYKTSSIKPSTSVKTSKSSVPPALPPTDHQPKISTVAHPESSTQDNKIVVNGKVYLRHEQLGKGGFSVVYRASSTDVKDCAVKCIDLKDSDTDSFKDCLNEISILKRLQGNEGIINLFENYHDEANQMLYLVMERGETDLRSFFLTSKKENPDNLLPLIRFCWLEMLKIVEVLHSNGIIHGDLKPQNFVVVKKKLKVIDFGISKTVLPDQTSALTDQITGTYNYMSPEAFTNLSTSGESENVTIKIGPKSDVWSLGCILYSMVYGSAPFQKIVHPLQKVLAITSPTHVIQFPPTMLGDKILQTLQKCLIRDVKLRPSVKELLEDPFVNRRSF